MVCGYICQFDSTSSWRAKLEFPCSSDWADTTDGWANVRKRRRQDPKKERPPKPTKTPKAAAPRDSLKVRVAARAAKELEAAAARSAGRVSKPAEEEQQQLQVVCKREAVKCTVVNFTGTGTKLCVPDVEPHTLHVQESWESLSNASCSTLNLDSGRKQNLFHKEQLLLQLHERSASLIKYLFSVPDSLRFQELKPDDISLPIRQPRSDQPKKKHVIVQPRDHVDVIRAGEDYVGALIPNASRPLGYGLLTTAGEAASIKLTRKTLEVPEFAPSKFLLPPVAPASSRAIPSPVIKVEDPSYIDSVSQLVGMLCIEPSSMSLPQNTIQKWLDTS